MKNVLLFLLIACMGCNADNDEVKQVVHKFFELEQLKSQKGNVNNEIMYEQYSEIMNNECEAKVAVKASPKDINGSGNAEMAHLHFRLKKFDKGWAITHFGVASATDHSFEYMTAPTPLDLKLLDAMIDEWKGQEGGDPKSSERTQSNYSTEDNETAIEQVSGSQNENDDIAFYVIVNRSYFYDEPDSNTKRKAYLVKGERVYIKRMHGSFGYTEFTNKGGLESKGWLILDELENGQVSPTDRYEADERWSSDAQTGFSLRELKKIAMTNSADHSNVTALLNSIQGNWRYVGDDDGKTMWVEDKSQSLMTYYNGKKIWEHLFFDKNQWLAVNQQIHQEHFALFSSDDENNTITKTYKGEDYVVQTCLTQLTTSHQPYGYKVLILRK